MHVHYIYMFVYSMVYSMKLDMYTSCIYMCVCSSQGSVEGSPTATDDVVPVAKKSRGSDEREEDGEEVTDTPAVTEAAAKGEGGQGQGEAGEGSVQSRKRKRDDEEAGNGGEGKSEGPEGKSVRLDPRGSGKPETYLQSCRYTIHLHVQCFF